MDFKVFQARHEGVTYKQALDQAKLWCDGARKFESKMIEAREKADLWIKYADHARKIEEGG